MHGLAAILTMVKPHWASKGMLADKVQLVQWSRRRGRARVVSAQYTPESAEYRVAFDGCVSVCVYSVCSPPLHAFDTMVHASSFSDLGVFSRSFSNSILPLSVERCAVVARSCSSSWPLLLGLSLLLTSYSFLLGIPS